MLVTAGLLSSKRLLLLWRQRDVLYWQRQCMNYSPSPDQVVYEDDPAAAEILLNQPSYFRGSSYINKSAIAMFVPPCWNEFEKHTNMGGFSGPSAAILFLHERTSSKGIRKLVLVECDPQWDPARSIPGYLGWSIIRPIRAGVDPATERTGEDFLAEAFGRPFHRLSALPDQEKSIRFFAGQPDPTDASHFTIAYEMPLGKGTIDGWLEPDGYQITLRIRDGPAKTP